MDNEAIVETERLYFRPWTMSEIDRDILYEINSDEELMRFYPFRRTREQSDETIERMINAFTPQGIGWGVVCLSETNEPIGFTGLNTVNFDAHFAPAVEIGWRLIRSHWGKGYATEIASGLLELGFNTIGLQEIVAFAVHNNHASIAVMKRLGMRNDSQDDFMIPGINKPYQHLRPHVLYRTSQAQWNRINGF